MFFPFWQSRAQLDAENYFAPYVLLGADAIPLTQQDYRIVAGNVVIQSFAEEEMKKYPIQLTQLVHENLSIVMSFAYSHRTLIDLMEKNFMGEWKYLRRAIFEIGEERANRAITELAVLMRILDDQERISDYYKQCGMKWNCGRLIKENGKVEELSPRQFSNKIIHSKTFEWDFSAEERPILICYAQDDDARKWIRSEVDLVGLAAFCGMLMS
jgi:hypothetical protein